MEQIVLPHLPDYPLQVGLFRKVQNAAFLRQQLLDGNTKFEYAFLDASVLLSRKHVLAACFRAINDKISGRLKSRNVHSEIVFSLSPNNNIAESFRRFGISDGSINVVAIKVGDDAAKVETHLRQNVEGEAVPFSDETLIGISDYARIRKIYALDSATKWERPEDRKESEAIIIGSMALKGS